MTFKVLLHPKTAKSLRKLDKEVQGRIKDRIKDLKELPEREKHLRYSNFWSLRVGDYRVIYELNKERKEVIVLFIAHRKHAYDDFSKLI